MFLDGNGLNLFSLERAAPYLRCDWLGISWAKMLSRGELHLVDIDARVLSPVAEAVGKLVAHAGKAFEISTHLHYRTALKDADFVVFIYAVGAYRAWKRDIATCTRFGVNQSVGDTIGPGAVIRILRSIHWQSKLRRKWRRYVLTPISLITPTRKARSVWQSRNTPPSNPSGFATERRIQRLNWRGRYSG